MLLAEYSHERFNLNLIVKKHSNKSKLRGLLHYDWVGFFGNVNIMKNKRAGGLFHVKKN